MTSRILHRSITHSYPVAVGGEGIRIIDSNGKQYIDASGGAAVSCLGHGHPDITRAMHEQADKLAFAHTSFFTTEPAERLADELIAHAPKGISHVYYVSGGSEAIEAALKMARQYHVERGEPQRKHFIARRQSYHGNTVGALSVGGNAWRRQQFAPMLIEAHHIAPCFEYRDRRPDETPEAYGTRTADELEAKILELGKDSVIAFVAEPVVGATLGAVTAAPGYFKRIREICDKYGVLLILDEVMCGMGRTGTLHAVEQEGISPDIMTIAKGLGGGYQPIGAILLGQHIFDSFKNGSGFFQHGHTYLGHPMACAAALAVQEVIKRDKLLDNVQAMGAHLMDRLQDRFGNHRHVGDIRGRGLFQAIELVQDRASKATFDPAKKLNARIKQEAMALGLMCYPMGGTIDGKHGDHVLLAPPFICTKSDIDLIVEKLGEAVDISLKSVA
ncbi:aspartate aminotransferase family protein [Ferrovibrio terrae]|uniref:Aspartate aminotransferase family protein n=1 Tax=Ferrovibrio terrae TaxID=2594003 RepID=A0A516GXP2_9PROT|nr:aspartate aminotransferase family protein [Ferrovibrio terrae]QDO96267.1 aspartate aminotransferase family protein [Ferrovibrio terrae]